jgi:hypothetical protein
MSTKCKSNIQQYDQTSKFPDSIKPRLVTRSQAAEYCCLSPQAFSAWVKMGRLPTAIRGTARWDLRAIDAALDATNDLTQAAELNALDQWRSSRARKP